VTLSLASIGLADHPVARQAARFLTSAVRPDGSWPIDSNLATWVTTLSVNALAAAGEEKLLDECVAIKDWLLGQQCRERHAYTGADPGGWGWTDLPGSVPDADDTPGALLALAHLPHDESSFEAALAGLRWLRGLQNSDGGWPTFCRGWGHLPFDRSGADLTAHVLRAIQAVSGWANSSSSHPCADIRKWSGAMMARGFAYLDRTQRADGSWLPLWFGNQFAHDDENPTYGTSRVLAAYRDLDKMNTNPARRAVDWLLSTQNSDGGWGGDKGIASSSEETALAVEVLLEAGAKAEPALNKGLSWLVHEVEAGGLDRPAPIGFYFAKLWYFEKLYPIIFTVAALGRARKKFSGD
jgi:squalene-hopene/tetraprenyl-beta-curcumene cyclase